MLQVLRRTITKHPLGAVVSLVIGTTIVVSGPLIFLWDQYLKQVRASHETDLKKKDLEIETKSREIKAKEEQFERFKASISPILVGGTKIDLSKYFLAGDATIDPSTATAFLGGRFFAMKPQGRFPQFYSGMQKVNSFLTGTSLEMSDINVLEGELETAYGSKIVNQFLWADANGYRIDGIKSPIYFHVVVSHFLNRNNSKLSTLLFRALASRNAFRFEGADANFEIHEIGEKQDVALLRGLTTFRKVTVNQKPAEYFYLHQIEMLFSVGAEVIIVKGIVPSHHSELNMDNSNNTVLVDWLRSFRIRK